MERKCIDITVTLNETPGKQGNQDIQSYIDEIEWSISDYNDIYGKEIHPYIDDIEWNIRETGNPIIY